MSALPQARARVHYSRRVPDTWPQYIDRVTSSATNKEIAQRIGIHASLISRWRSNEAQPSAKHAVAFAKGYRRPPQEALLVIGLLTDEDVELLDGLPPSVTELPTEDLFAEISRLLAEIKRRLAQGRAARADDTEHWAPPDWRLPGSEDSGMHGDENGNEGGAL